MKTLWLGQVDYIDAWQLQRELAALRADEIVGDILLLMEHPPTITLGRGADPKNILATPQRLASLGVRVEAIDRGGDVTYHGPGQLVGYPIFHLVEHRKDLHWFLRQIEEALIVALAEFGISGTRFPPHTGVWVEQKKIAAIGIKVSRWVSTHGFALNVSMEGEAFSLIVPCGIHDYGVTTLQEVVGRSVEMTALLPVVRQGFRVAFRTGEETEIPLELLTENSKKIVVKGLDVAKTLC